MGKSASGLVLLKRKEGLLIAIFEDMKAGPVEAMQGFVVVGNDNVDENKAGAGANRGRRGVLGWRGERRKENQSWQDE